MRQERQAAKMARMQERRKGKEERRGERGCRGKHASKEELLEKKQAREERLKQRLEERRARKEKQNGQVDERDNDAAEWPITASRLFLDGNNMMFITPVLRSLTLNRGQRGRAEGLLASVAESFVNNQSQAASGGKLDDAVLIFDNTHTNTTKTLTGGTTFRICSARPHTPTSDEVLIAWANEAKKTGESSKMVFVTSDRGLRDQLREAGGILMKPKQFLRLAYLLAKQQPTEACMGTDAINNVSDIDLDAWFGSLL